MEKVFTIVCGLVFTAEAQLSVVSTEGYFKILGFGSMEKVFTIMCGLV